MVRCIIFLFLVTISLNLKVTNAIINGHPVTGQKRYMVYLIQDKTAKTFYVSWLCGGAIIHHLYILTAASCVFDAQHVYVISGYNKSVDSREMDRDPCVMEKKRKIVQVCAPAKFIDYYMYNYIDYWNRGDICVAKVDVPFDFHDLSYYKICSYPPAPIRVNLMHKFMEPGREVITLGWGSREFYRPVNSFLDLNEEYLQYSSGKVTPKQECIDTWGFEKEHKTYLYNLQLFYICVDKPGHLDENGQAHYKSDDIYVDCNQKVPGRMGNNANESTMDCMKRVALRNGITDINATTGGFCQNDHGGPLVSWIGGVETLIGITTMCGINKKMQCRPPYLYTSSVCFNRVIACYLGTSRRTTNCNRVMQEEAIILDIDRSLTIRQNSGRL